MMNILRKKIKKLRLKRKRSSDIPLNETVEPLIPNTDVHECSHHRLRSEPVLRFNHWIYTHKFLLIMLILIFIPILLYLILLILSIKHTFIPIQLMQERHHVLVVVAHPDDECLFFSPTIRILNKQSHINLSLLVFSRGNHAGLGNLRARELLNSCQTLNISKDHCISLDILNVQDDPNVWWLKEQLIPIINQYIDRWSIDVLISFDSKGVSGHINHRAVGSAVRYLTENNMNQTKIKMSYELKSVSIPRKYSSLLDTYLVFIRFLPYLLHLLLSHLLPFNLISSPNSLDMLLISTPNDYMISRAAFASHQSQYSWDRYMYLVISRYMFINELKYIHK